MRVAGLSIRRRPGVTATEVMSALQRMGSLKAVPAHCAPGILWKACAPQLAHWLDLVLLQTWQEQVRISREWMDVWLCLLPKRPSHPKSPGDLHPIGLLDPLGKSVLLAIKLRVHPKVTACLHEYPQFAFMAGRSTQHALSGATALPGRTNFSSKSTSYTEPAPTVAREPFRFHWTTLKPSTLWTGAISSLLLLAAGFPLDEIHRIEQWHAQVTYHVQSNTGGSATIPTNQGIRQGCPIAPTLWAAYTLLLMDAVREKLARLGCLST